MRREEDEKREWRKVQGNTIVEKSAGEKRSGPIGIVYASPPPLPSLLIV